MRVALLTNILSPYRVPAFRALGVTPDWRLLVCVNAASEFDRSWRVDTSGLEVERIRSWSFVRGGRTLHVPSPWSLARSLRRFRPDVVVSAELGARTLLAWLYCALFRIPLVVWAEPTRARLRDADRLRRRLGPFLLERAAAVAVPGGEALRALAGWGVPAQRLHRAPNVHDAEAFEKALASLDRDALHRDLRAGLGARARIALVAGRLLEVKGILPLLEAWQRLPSALRDAWTLLFVGSGPLAPEVERAQQSHPPGEILRVPALQPIELVAFYAAADLLVFPSLGDVWGIAVNEAMACGLPVLCSSRAGCAEDLLRPGENGWLVDPLDADAFVATLEQALRSDQRERLGERARERVAGLTAEALAEGLRRAVRAARAAPPAS